MKTRQQLQEQVDLTKQLETERKKNDEAYAIKLVERIVFGMIGLILTAVLVAIVALVIRK